MKYTTIEDKTHKRITIDENNKVVMVDAYLKYKYPVNSKITEEDIKEKFTVIKTVKI
jgi:hypothetical protein